MNKVELLKKYARAIVHLKQQLKANKFGLVLGSGISKPFNIPNWYDLIKRIAGNPEVDGEDILIFKKDSSPQSSLIQMLYEHYKAKEIEKSPDPRNTFSKDFDRKVQSQWLNIIHAELWKEFNPTLLEKGKHPYMDSFINIIRESTLTINYNFDDTIQQLISLRRTDEEREEGVKGFETVWDARLQFQSDSGIIYHPNGFLPYNKVEGSSNNLVFAEDSFADQLIASMAGHYSTLLHHLSKNTCLFLGLSLEDSTLKHLLRQNSQISPGHYHYYVAFTEDSSSIPECKKNAIIESNFELYNLITLFLNNDEIKTISELLQMKEKDIEELGTIHGIPLKYVFYLTGGVGCGKTTTLSYFRNLSTHAEWPDPKHPLLALPSYELNPEQKKDVDDWLARMFFKKNKNIRNNPVAINVIDRTPLDPITFTDKIEWQDKALFLDNQITKGTSKFRIEPGSIILLKGDEETIARRIRMRIKSEKQYTAKDIRLMYEKFKEIFSYLKCVQEVDTIDLSELEVVKIVARIIHIEEYCPDELHLVLDRLKSI
jgi:hypothetical protein